MISEDLATKGISSSSSLEPHLVTHKHTTLTPPLHAGTDHVTPLENGISELASGVVNVQDEQRYMRARERMHRDTTESTNSRVLWFTFLETFLLISMSVWQIWTLRRFFSVSAEI